MVNPPEQPFTAPEGGEQQSARWRSVRVVVGVARKTRSQASAGRCGIVDVELYHLALTNSLTDGKRPVVSVRTDYVADQEIARLELILERVHKDADLQRAPDQSFLSFVALVKQAAQNVQRQLAIKFRDHVVVGTCYDHSCPDRTATLGDDAIDHHVAAERDAHGAGSAGAAV